MIKSMEFFSSPPFPKIGGTAFFFSSLTKRITVHMLFVLVNSFINFKETMPLLGEHNSVLPSATIKIQKN